MVNKKYNILFLISYFKHITSENEIDVKNLLKKVNVSIKSDLEIGPVITIGSKLPMDNKKPRSFLSKKLIRVSNL